MREKQLQHRIAIIVSTVIALALVIFLLSYSYFFNRDQYTNEQLRLPDSEETNEYSTVGRTYHIVYDSNDDKSVALKDNIHHVIQSLKVKHYITDVEKAQAVDEDDIILLTVLQWTNYYDQIQELLHSVDYGASMFVASVPGEDGFFRTAFQSNGIYAIEHTSYNGVWNIDENIILGLYEGDRLEFDWIYDLIFNLHVDDRATVYIESQTGVPIYFTMDYGMGTIGVFNGTNIEDRAFHGVICSILGTLNKDFVQPIINSATIFIDDWPAPYAFRDGLIFEQYGMDFDVFLKNVWWPDMVALIERHDIRFTGTLLSVNEDGQQVMIDDEKDIFDSEMFIHYQQVVSRGGEISMHGYNHDPLLFEPYQDENMAQWYTPWSNPEEVEQLFQYTIDNLTNIFPKYQINSYIPPLNLLDETGIDVVQESMGTPVIIHGLYNSTQAQQPSFDFTVDEETIYYPRLSDGSVFNDRLKGMLAFGASAYGVVSHIIYPDDVIDPNRNGGLEWEQMRVHYSDMFKFIRQSYPFIEYRTATQAANQMVDWYDRTLDIQYASTYIKISTDQEVDTYTVLLRTDKEPQNGDGYTVNHVSEGVYYLEISKPQVVVSLEGK